MGFYLTSANLYDIAGRENVRLSSNLDQADATEDSSRVDRAIAWAESRLHQRLRPIYSLPLTLSDDELLQVRDACARLAIWWLAQNRGVADGGEQVGGRMENHRVIAEEQIGRWACLLDRLTLAAPAARGSTTSAPLPATGH